MPLIDSQQGRIANVSSASGPNFVASCSEERQEIEELMEECLAVADGDGDFESAGLGQGSAYGLSKACLNAYTIALAREHPDLLNNACPPGFIETHLTRPYVEAQGGKPLLVTADDGAMVAADGTEDEI